MGIATGMAIPMPSDISQDTAASFYRLLSWLSPSYPVGAFSYSHGLEWAVESGDAVDRETMVGWIGQLLTLGGGRNDAIIFHAAYWAARTGDTDHLWDIAELAEAFVPSSERRLETLAQGTAFCRITHAAWSGRMIAELAGDDTRQVAYPVAVAAAVADHDIEVALGLHAYLHAFMANLVSAGVRLIPLGHTDGQKAIVQLEPVVTEATTIGLNADLSQLGGATVLSDIGSMLHETQYTRLFRS